MSLEFGMMILFGKSHYSPSQAPDAAYGTACLDQFLQYKYPKGMEQVASGFRPEGIIVHVHPPAEIIQPSDLLSFLQVFIQSKPDHLI